jgi:hypothetical protein
VKNNQTLNLSNADRKALANMAYAENGGEDNDTVKMTVQTALNRLRSGRTKEFGGTMQDVLKKGYYAVSKNSPLHQQAVSGKFPDLQSKARHAEVSKLTDAVVGDGDYGEGLFYFRPQEANGLKKKLKSQGNVGKYEVYSY